MNLDSFRESEGIQNGREKYSQIFSVAPLVTLIIIIVPAIRILKMITIIFVPMSKFEWL